MPKYNINGETFRRKNLYMPCVIGERFDDMSEAEQVAIYKATYWADNITAAEWPVVLGEDTATAPNRSRLKKKAAGWVMALARISVINPELLADILQRAREMYGDQIGKDMPWGALAAGLAGLELDESAGVELRTLRKGADEDD